MAGVIGLGMSDKQNEELYGPKRVLARQACREFCTKDSVVDALERRVASCFQSDWTSSTKSAYTDKQQGAAEPKPRSILKKKNLRDPQRSSNIKLLSWDANKRVRYATTQQDFDGHKNRDLDLFQGKKVKESQEKNFADFGPHTKDGTKMELSEYQCKFIDDPDHKRPVPRTKEDRLKRTNEKKETHFTLGDCVHSFKSETDHAFVESGQPLVFNGEKPTRNTSNVFRSGDFNVDHKVIPESVTKKDFSPSHVSPRLKEADCAPKEPPKGGCSRFPPIGDVDYSHRSTNFKLGNAPFNQHTVYGREFLMGNKHLEKPRIASPTPQSLKVFPKLPEYRLTGLTEHADEFRNHGIENIQQICQETKRVMCNNQTRKSTLSLADDLLISGGCRSKPFSQTTTDFIRPTAATLPTNVTQKIQKEQQGNYNHVNNGDIEIMQSEAKEKFKPIKQASKQGTWGWERMNRQRENKSTHFQFGSDFNTSTSEQKNQYRVWQPMDETAKPAGIGSKNSPNSSAEGPIIPSAQVGTKKGQGRRVYGIGWVEDQEEAVSTSVMKQDYSQNKSFTQSQKVLLNYKPPPSLETYFYPRDVSQASAKAITSLDFIPPAKRIY